MSGRFADLMALSASQTRQSDLATQHLLAEKKRKEEQRRKEQQEKDRKDRELQSKLAQKRLEDQQREEERKQKAEEDRHQREMVLQRREEEHRKNLIYGKERRSGWASSGGGGGGNGGGGGRTRRAKHGLDDDDEGTTQVLTREEKRQRRLNADLSRSFSSVRKVGLQSSSHSPRARPSKSVKVVDSLPSESRLMESHPSQHSTLPSVGTPNSTMSIRQQLAAMPTTLMRLGTVKRDTRTIDEIMTDMHKAKEAKVIAGEEARGFSDWFQDRKKREPAIPTKVPSLDPSLSPASSGATAPYPSSSRIKDYTQASRSTAPEHPRIAQATERKEPRTKVTIVKPDAKGSLSFSKASKVTSSASTKSASSVSRASNSQLSRMASGFSLPSKKRARSYSLSDSDNDSPPSRRRPGVSTGRNDISSEIWKLFGKDRDRYMQNDVFSDDDDDDMEADADALRREELRSMRIAKKEDEAALEEEKRHEEEKRRRRKEKDKKGY